MGARGPAPKRSDQRLGHQTKAEKAAVSRVGVSGKVSWPRVRNSWHPIARDWYRSLRDSGQSRFFEPSDVAAARYVAEAISQNLAAEKFSAQMFSAVWSAMNDLLSTEASRRRVRMEIERSDPAAGAPSDQPVTQLDDYRSLYS